MTSVVKFSRTRMDFLLKDPRGPVGRYLRRKAIIMASGARKQVGVKTGRLRQSIHWRHERNTRYQRVLVIASARHAYAHHEGTRPHLILPRRRKALSFSARGRLVVAKVVRHPGTKPNRYLKDQFRVL